MRTPLVLLALSTLAACGTTGSATRANRAPVPLSETYATLGDALRVLPNVQVNGDYVTYRGTSTLTGDEEMRFLVEGRIVGKLTNAESLYPLTEVRRVRLIRPQMAASNFGALGGNGLIELVLMP